MKKIYVLKSVFAIFILMSLFACSKNNDAATAHTASTTPTKPEIVKTADTISYYFSPIDTIHIIRIIYTDTLGNDITVTDLSKLRFWSVRFPVTVKPFIAKIRAEVINLTGKISNYTAGIGLNGTSIVVVPMKVDVQAGSYVANAEFTLQ